MVGPDRQEGSGTPAASSGVAAAKSAGKAGRNLPAAIGVGGGLGIGLILVLVFVPLVWIGVVAAALAVATYEVSKRLREGGVLVMPQIHRKLGASFNIQAGLGVERNRGDVARPRAGIRIIREL